MENKEVLIQFNPETGMFEEYKEPYMTIECPTKEDYDYLQGIVSYYRNRPQWHDAKTDQPNEPGEYIVMSDKKATPTALPL